MKYKVWKAWVASLPWSLRWFVVLILIRPAVDIFYFLKQISPLLSPLYIVGVLTPVFIFAGFFFARDFPRRSATVLDHLMGAWGLLLLFNVLAVFTVEVSISTFELATKVLAPVYLYFFISRLIRSQQDLMGVLTTFLYSSVVPFGMMLYELIIGPLTPVVATRGYERHEGLYADVMSYAIYVVGAFLVVSYMFLRQHRSLPAPRHMARFLLVAMLALVALINMHHAASWGVVGVLVALLAFFGLARRQFSIMLVLVMAGFLGVTIFGQEIAERVTVMFQTDMAVVQGEKEIESSFHGRMSRWMNYVDEWESLPLPSMIFGVGLSSGAPVRVMMLHGIHNDYLRVAFASGILGFLIYLAAYVWIFLSSLRKEGPERYLTWGALVVMLAYSLTTVPSLYLPLMYLILSIFCYAALPLQPTAQRVSPQQIRRPRHSSRRRPLARRRAVELAQARPDE